MRREPARHRPAAGAPPLIVHVIDQLDVGGLENGLVNLINHMPPGRYRHAIVCLKNATSFRQRLSAPGVDVISLDKREGKDPAHYLRLYRLLRQLRPSLVHTRNLAASRRNCWRPSPACACACMANTGATSTTCKAPTANTGCCAS